MCTVTVVSGQDSIRLACNRDEQRTRPAALPPRIAQFRRHRAVLPVDPVSGGTWIAASDAGLVMTLLNVNESSRGLKRETTVASRGTIIPAFLAEDSLETAVAAALRLKPEHYPPFRLVIVDRLGAAEIRSDGHGLELAGRSALERPLLFTSSGLGDELVERPRRTLFEECFHEPVDVFDQQEQFHRHHWPDRPQLSVCMTRPDARTVSYTVVSLEANQATLAYHADAPDVLTEPQTLAIALCKGGAP